MTNLHTATFQGKTFTRTSQSRTYTHCVAVVRPEWTNGRNGYTSPVWEGVETWSSTKALADKAAANLRNRRHYTGTERGGYRRRVQGNGPAIYSVVVVLPVTLQAKTPKASTPAADLARRKAVTARRAAKFGLSAAYQIEVARARGPIADDQIDYLAEWAARAARDAWHLAGERLALDIPARDPEGAIVAPTVLDVPPTMEGDVLPALKRPSPNALAGVGDAIRTVLAADAARAVAGVVIDATGPDSYTVIADGVEMTGLSPDAAREIYNAHKGLGGDIIVLKEGGVL